MDNMKGLGSALPARGKKGKPQKPAPEDEEDEEDEDFEVLESNIPGAQGGSLSKAQIQAALAGLGGNPGLAAALQGKLDSMVGRSSGYIETLPAKVKRRIEGLEKLQEEHDELEEKFNEERKALEEKYRQLYQPLYSKRAAIVTGASDVEHPAEEKESDDKEAVGEDGEPIVGIPQFWLNAFRNNDVLAEQITEKDEAALAYLTDVREAPLTGEEKGFALEFDFAENPFFANKTLTKKYLMVDEDEPILEKAVGCDIEWSVGKNLCVKVMKKKPKKGSKNTKPITKLEPAESFFNFFSPPKVPEEDEEIDEEQAEALQEALEGDYEMGAAVRERVIPQAIKWFTGEALEDEDYEEEDEDEDEEDDDDDEDDEDEDEEEEEKPAPKKGGRGKGGKAPAGGAGGEQPPECKQQ